MSVNPVSSYGRTSGLTSALQAQQSTLSLLTSQLSSQKKFSNLTDYNANEALSLINLQSTATQKEAYINVINTVSNNLSIYDSTLIDLESIVSQAQSLCNNSPTYSADTASNIFVQANSYLKSVTVDLNQNINGRYIYSGSRYTTQPVEDLSELPTATLSSTILSDNSTVPTYDSAASLYLSTAGQAITVDGSAGSGQVASIDIDGTSYSYTVLPTDTPTMVATALGALLTADGVAFTQAGATLTLNAGATINSAAVTTTNMSAYATDQAQVDTGYDLNYGITSNDPSIQQLIAGLRFMQAAGNATDSATYTTNMNQASILLSAALTNIQTLHTTVANNIGTMASEKVAQQKAISNLTEQVLDIQQVDITQVSTEITSLETVLQASYAATGGILKMSIVSYL